MRHRPALTILFFVNVLNIYDRQALGALLEPLRHEFHLSDTQLGALPAVFTVVYAVAGLPLGRLADTWSRRRLLAIGVAVWAALTALGSLAASYTFLFATRLGVGIGEAVCAPTATSWIGDLVPSARRARAMAGFMMAVPIGVMLSFAVTGPVAQAHGWRVALALAATPAVVLVPTLLWLQEPGRGASPGAGQEPGDRPTDRKSEPLSLLKIPALWWIAASGAIVNYVLYSFSTFVSAFLTRFHGLSVAQAGLWSGIGSGAAGILGAVAAGVYGDRVIGAWQNGRVLLAAAAAALAAPLALAGILAPAGRAALALPLFMLAYGLWQMYYGLVYAAIHDIVPSGLRGTAMAAYYMAMYLCGGSFGPLVTGRLSDHFARQAAAGGPVTEAAKAAGLHQAMYAIPALSVALAAVLWAAARSMRPSDPLVERPLRLP
ncbi:MAG: MFS transporter [Acidobacteriia bacterium]|nr:MFS transporter [Terriglobia bacterium]